MFPETQWLEQPAIDAFFAGKPEDAFDALRAIESDHTQPDDARRRARRAAIGHALSNCRPDTLSKLVNGLVCLGVSTSLWWQEQPEFSLPDAELARLIRTVASLDASFPICSLRDGDGVVVQAVSWAAVFIRDYFAGGELRAPAWYLSHVIDGTSNDAVGRNIRPRGPRIDRGAWTQALSVHREARAWFSPQRAVMLALASGKWGTRTAREICGCIAQGWRLLARGSGGTDPSARR